MTITALRPSRRVVVAIAAGLAVLAGFSEAAFGQGNLATLPGLTPLQQPTATAVNAACVQFAPAGYVPNPGGTPAERLFYSCRVMVQTANQLAGSQPDAASLNISNAELRTGVQAVSAVQMNAQKQMSVEAAKMNLLGARLLDIRGGARGFMVSRNGQEVQPAGGSLAQVKSLEGATGGAAAADDALGGRWGGFFNVGYSWGNVDQTDVWDAYKYRSVNLIAGADYRVSDSLVLGGAISYSDTRSDYDQSLGNVKAATTGVAGYGTYYIDSWYVDGFLAYGFIDYDSTRNIYIRSNSGIPPINTSATAKPKGNQWSASIGVGRNFEAGSLTVTPTARLGYIWVKNKSFSEDEPNNGLGLAVDARTIRSLQSALGGRLSTNVSTSVGVFGPYLSAQWLHEFENDSPSIISKYVNDPFNTFFAIPTGSPTRDYAVLIAGTSATFPNNLSGFLQFSAAVGLQNESNYGVVLGIRKQF
jgi:outer membrane autotransporter protein